MSKANEIDIQQGAPFAADIIIYDNTVVPEIPLDITGLVVFISIEKLTDFGQDDTQAVITSKITVHTDPAAGETLWALTKSETLVPVGKYKADIKLYTTDDVFVNSDTFYVNVVPIVTHRIA